MIQTNLIPSRDIGGFPGVMMILFVAFGGLLFGYDTGTISGVSPISSTMGQCNMNKTYPEHYAYKAETTIR